MFNIIIPIVFYSSCFPNCPRSFTGQLLVHFVDQLVSSPYFFSTLAQTDKHMRIAPMGHNDSIILSLNTDWELVEWIIKLTGSLSKKQGKCSQSARWISSRESNICKTDQTRRLHEERTARVLISCIRNNEWNIYLSKVAFIRLRLIGMLNIKMLK